MTSTLLDITNKVDSTTSSILRTVSACARDLEIPALVIGATARDLVLHHYYGAEVSRATRDLDFAVQVPDWAAFEALKSKLLETGFVQSSMEQRLKTSHGGWIDLVPFGPLSLDGQSIAWPPKGDVVMNVLGFSEAFENALQVKISDSPACEIPVVSPVGLALLKLVSWTEREPERRPNDAKDLLYLCANYQRIPRVSDAMYSQEQMMDSYGWVPERGSANLLGGDVRQIVNTNTHEYLEQLFHEKISNRPLKLLIRESCETGAAAERYEAHEAVLNAFIDGYRVP